MVFQINQLTQCGNVLGKFVEVSVDGFSAAYCTAALRRASLPLM